MTADEPAELARDVQRAVPWALVTVAARTLIALTGMVLLVRYLAPREYAVWGLLVAQSGPVQLVTSFGYGHLLTRNLPSETEAEVVARTVWPIVLRRLGWGALCSAIIAALFPLYAEPLGLTGYGPHVVLYQLAIVSQLGSAYLVQALSLRFRQRAVAALTLLGQLATLASTLVGIGIGAPLLFFAGAAALVSAGHLCAAAWVFGARFGFPAERSARRPRESEAHRRYRLHSYAGDFGATLLNSGVDRYLVAALSSSLEVALYVVATTVVERLRGLLPTRLLRALFEATFFRQYAESGSEAVLDRMFGLILLVSSATAFGFLAVLAPLSNEALGLVFRAEYAAGWSIVVLFLLTMWIHELPVGLVLRAVRRTDVLLRVQWTIALNLVLGLLLVPSAGALGMALATATSVVAKNSILLRRAQEEVGLSMPWRGLGKCALGAGLTISALLALKAFAPVADVPRLIACALLGAGLYAGLLRALRPFDAEQRRLLNTIAPPRLAPFIRWTLG